MQKCPSLTKFLPNCYIALVSNWESFCEHACLMASLFSLGSPNWNKLTKFTNLILVGFIPCSCRPSFIGMHISTLVCRVSGLACWAAWQHAHNFLVMFAWLHPKPYQPAFCPNLDSYSNQNETEKEEEKFHRFHFNVHASDYQSNVSSWNFSVTLNLNI